jgi:hypothetical protein
LDRRRVSGEPGGRAKVDVVAAPAGRLQFAVLKRVVPLTDGGRTVAGTAAWERFRELKFLRDELLHVKERGYDPDPDVRTAYDRLTVGEGDHCVEAALSVIQGAFPDFLPDHVLEELGA